MRKRLYDIFLFVVFAASVGALLATIWPSNSALAQYGTPHAIQPIVCDHVSVINLAASGPTTIVTGVAGTQTYICSLSIFPMGTATNVGFVEGTGTNCSTVSAGLIGGTTAANGGNFAANGGITLGSGYGIVLRSATAGDNICISESAGNQISGSIGWTQF